MLMDMLIYNLKIEIKEYLKSNGIDLDILYIAYNDAYLDSINAVIKYMLQDFKSITLDDYLDSDNISYTFDVDDVFLDDEFNIYIKLEKENGYNE